MRSIFIYFGLVLLVCGGASAQVDPPSFTDDNQMPPVTKISADQYKLQIAAAKERAGKGKECNLPFAEKYNKNSVYDVAKYNRDILNAVFSKQKHLPKLTVELTQNRAPPYVGTAFDQDKRACEENAGIGNCVEMQGRFSPASRVMIACQTKQLIVASFLPCEAQEIAAKVRQFLQAMNIYCNAKKSGPAGGSTENRQMLSR